MTWTVRKTVPTLAVPALDAGVAFYERLGFREAWRWPSDAPTFAGLARGDAELMLAQCDPAEAAAVCFLVDDVDACHAELLDGRAWELAERFGALAERPDCPPRRAPAPPPAPETRPYGRREFVLVDPWGHELQFGQEVDA